MHATSLAQFAARQRPGSVQIVHKAVGGHVGVTHFDAADPLGGALASETGSRTIEVEMTTLDASIGTTNFQGPYLLKLDTHGYEKQILDGAEKVLANTSVCVIEAYNHQITSEALRFWELCAALDDRGFRPARIADITHRQLDQSLWQMDLVFVRSTWPGFGVTTYA